MERISSIKNERIAAYRKLSDRSGRQEQGLFIVEGPKLAGEALASGLVPQELLFTEAFQGQELLAQARASGCAVTEVAPHILERLSDTKAPQPLLCICKLPAPRLSLPAGARFGLVLDALRDPGNVGTMLRSAEAFGMDFVLTWEGADPYQPKVVRAAAGALFRIPLICANSAEDGLNLLEAAGFSLYAATLEAGSLPVHQTHFQAPCALLIGNEGSGINPAVRARCGHALHLPMMGQTESLNASIAAAVLMWELSRKQREGIEGG